MNGGKECIQSMVQLQAIDEIDPAFWGVSCACSAELMTLLDGHYLQRGCNGF